MWGQKFATPEHFQLHKCMVGCSKFNPFSQGPSKLDFCINLAHRLADTETAQ